MSTWTGSPARKNVHCGPIGLKTLRVRPSQIDSTLNLLGSWKKLTDIQYYSLTVLKGNVDVRIATHQPKDPDDIFDSFECRRGLTIKKVHSINPDGSEVLGPMRGLFIRYGVRSAADAAFAVTGGDIVIGIMTEPGVIDVADGVELSTPTNRSGNVGTTSAQVAAKNASREYFFIQNTHASQNLIINGSNDTNTTDPVSTGPALVTLYPGDVYEMSKKIGNLLLGDIRAVGSGAATTFVAWEAEGAPIESVTS